MSGMVEDRREVPGAALGGVVLAATIMIMLGLFQFLQGLAATINDEFFVVLPNYAFAIDVTTWGWIHMILGVLIMVAGFFLFTGSAVAGAVAIAMAVLAAVSNFFFIPYYPFWSLLIIAISVYVIWSITRAGRFAS